MFLSHGESGKIGRAGRADVDAPASSLTDASLIRSNDVAKHYDTTVSSFRPLISVATAIPTFHSGHYFRSRLEARYAVLFESLGIDYDYELQGFKFLDGTCYLPDFWLPKVRMWAEVKPLELTADERMKCQWLAEGTLRPCLHLVGTPGFKFYIASHFEDLDGEVQRYEYPYLLDIDYHGRKHYNAGRLYSDMQPFDDPDQFSTTYWGAVYKARMARFDDEVAA